MSWLFPIYFAGFAAVALPILLHLLRRRPTRRFAFPSLRFLAATQQSNDRHQRLRRWIVLALRCAALLLLAAAFARPFFGSNRSAGGRATVVVIDNSFSLQAKGRWEALRQWALDQIGHPASGDKLGLLLMAPRPTWLAPLSGDPAGAMATLTALPPGWESSRVDPALRLAADTLAALPVETRRIILLGDHQRSSWFGCDFSKALPPGVDASFPAVPPPIVRQAAVRPPVISRRETGLHAVVTIRNYTGAQRRTLSVFRDAAPIAVRVQAVDLPENDSRTIELDLECDPQKPARLAFALDEDDLPADDIAYAVWQPDEGHAVFLDPPPTGGDGDFIAIALASTADLKPALRVLPAGNGWGVNTVVILRNDESFAGDAAKRLDVFFRGGGSALVFSSGPNQRTWLATHGVASQAGTAENGPWEARGWSMEHPLIRDLAEYRVNALLGWDFGQVEQLSPQTVEPLALWSDKAAAIGETKIGAGHLLICGFAVDRRDSEFPVLPVFVPFIHRAVAYLMGAQEATAVAPGQVGRAIALPADSGTWRAITGPALGEKPLALSGSVVPDRPGIYEFAYGTERRLYAVNLSPEESDPTAWTDGTPWLGLASHQSAPQKALSTVALGSMDAEQHAPLWWWCFAAMAALLLAEIAVANRTTR